MASACVVSRLNPVVALGANASPSTRSAPARVPTAGVKSSRHSVLVSAKRRKGKGNQGAFVSGFKGGFRGDLIDERAPKKEEVAELVSSTPDGPPDFWEDEKFDNLGKLTQFAGIIIAVLAIGIGAFAGNTYNEGAAPVDYQSADSPATAVKIAIEGATRLD